jgi:transcriptional regulator with XRE-family HTH domain
MTKGAQRFARLLADLDLSEREAAEKLQCSQSLVNYVKRGQRAPGRKLASRIRELSAANGSTPIEPEEWDEEAPSATGTDG